MSIKLANFGNNTQSLSPSLSLPPLRNKDDHCQQKEDEKHEKEREKERKKQEKERERLEKERKRKEEAYLKNRQKGLKTYKVSECPSFPHVYWILIIRQLRIVAAQVLSKINSTLKYHTHVLLSAYAYTCTYISTEMSA